MPILIVEQLDPEDGVDEALPVETAPAAGAAQGLHKSRRAGLLKRRVLLGRLPCCGIRCDDSAVSRLHAWIDRDAGGSFITDSGSLTGTLVNGRAIDRRMQLSDGDQIKIGATAIVYQEKSELPRDLETLELEDIPHGAPAKFGVVFDCVCGTPSWVKWTGVGKPFVCKQCGHTVLPPAIPGARARRAAADSIVESRSDRSNSDSTIHSGFGSAAVMQAGSAPSALATGANLLEAPDALRTCSICHTALGAHEAQTTCPECGLTFHAQCWQENYGCSAYGCSQVNVLKPHKSADRAAEERTAAADAVAEGKSPWESILLACSALCALLSALTYGAPSAVVGVASLVYLVAGKPRRRGLVLLALAIAVVGVATGVAASMFWWSSRPAWEKN